MKIKENWKGGRGEGKPVQQFPVCCAGFSQVANESKSWGKREQDVSSSKIEALKVIE